MVRTQLTRSILSIGALAALAGCQPGASAEAPEAPEEDTPDEVTETVDQPTPTEEPDTSADDGQTPSTGAADGTYRASGGYQSPNGPETIEVSITIADGVIEAVEVTPGATNSTSKRYQGDFAGGVGAEVIGKSLDEADVTRVAGSSLTSGGFAEALQTIRQDAKVG